MLIIPRHPFTIVATVNASRCLGWFIGGLLLCVFISATAVAQGVKPRAVISIIIDDIGYRADEGAAMINLTGNLTFAVLPNAPKTEQLANLAHQQGKEVILHMPMQSVLGVQAEDGVLNVEMAEAAVVDALTQAFNNVPYAIGMNNHQGSLLTRHPGHMTWVMKAMREGGYFFVDSRTTKHSVAEVMANEQGVRVVRRDVFLDHTVDKECIRFEFNRLIKIALKKGRAVAIGHPYAETLAVLEEMLPRLDALGIDLVPISQQIKSQQVLLKAGVSTPALTGG